MSLTSNGFTPKRYPEIVQELNSNLKALANTDVDTSEYSLIGNMHSNIALALMQLWDLAQNVYSSSDLYNAEGSSLDNLALLFGISRQQSSRTNGYVHLTGKDGTTISSGSRVASIKGDQFEIVDQTTISATDCVELRVYPSIVLDSTNYIFVLDDVTYTVASGTGATHSSIIDDLELALQVDGSVTLTKFINAQDDSKSYLLISKNDQTSTMKITGSTYFSYDYVVTPTEVRAINYGVVAGDAYAINKILSGVTGWYSVTNPNDLTLGRNIQTDLELRDSIYTAFKSVGSGTYTSIGSALKKVEGVKSVYIRENPTLTTDVNSVPPLSYEVIVNGGLDNDIAKVVWETKPLAKQTHGNTQVIVKDFNGYDKTVKFSRPIEKYIFIDVRYSPYTEEVLPNGAIDNAKLAIKRYADNNLTINTDVIAKRFLGSIYSASTGFGDVVVKVASSANPQTIPSYPADYSDVIAVADNEITSFATNRITFTEV